MAVPVGELRFAHFDEPGTQLQPGKWTGPTQLMVMEHRSDDSSLFVRPFLEGDEDEPRDREENMQEVPTQKKRGGKHYTELVVFDKCPTSLLPYTLPIGEPENISQNVAMFEFAQRPGDSMSITVLRQYCPEDMQGFTRDISSPSLTRSSSGGSVDAIAKQIGKLAQVIDSLTFAQTQSFAGQQAMEARLRVLEHPPTPTAATQPGAGGTGAVPPRKGVLGALQPDELSDPDDWDDLHARRPGSDPTSGASRKSVRGGASAAQTGHGQQPSTEISGISRRCARPWRRA